MINSLPTLVKGNSLAQWQPDQRLQQDAQMLNDVFALTFMGGATTNGLFGVALQMIVGFAYACTICWGMVFLVLGFALTMVAISYTLQLPQANGILRLQQAEGNFRNAHALIREFAEGIAFYRGEKTEEARVEGILRNEVAWRQLLFFLRQLPGVIAAVTFSLTMFGVPLVFLNILVFYIDPNSAFASQLNATNIPTAQSFFSAIAVQVSWLSTACAGLGSLSGYSKRVTAFLEFSEEAASFEGNRGKTYESQGRSVKLEALDVCSPSTVSTHGHFLPCRALVNALSFEVHPSSGLAIDGPSCAGKSAIFRVIAGLWPQGKGKVTMPPIGRGCFFVPQSVYTNEGTLTQQVVYPDADQAADIPKVIRCLESVGLSYIVEHWGLDKSESWVSFLSGGEMQRLGIARLLYRQPCVAFLDEATSALDAATEKLCLQAIHDSGITPISISHRESCWRFHSQILKLSSSSEDAWSITNFE